MSTLVTPTPPVVGRDRALDVLRGAAIISMTAAHVATDTYTYRLTHVPLWMDAAIVFVLLSGLVLGIVQRSSANKGRTNYPRTARRAMALYVIYLAVLAIAVALRALTGAPALAPTPADHGGWGGLVFYALTLQMPAPNLTILPMYVVLLLAAVPLLWMCAHRLAWAGMAAAVAIWLLGVLSPAFTVMPHIQDAGVPRFNWATWLLPFALAFVVGWHWRQWDLARRLRTWPAIAVTGVLFVALVALSNVVDRWELFELPRVLRAAFFKWDVGLGVVLFGSTAIMFGYGLVSRSGSLLIARYPLRWLALIGSWSLDSFVIQCLFVVLVPVVAPHAPDPAILIAALLVMTAWALLRQKRKEAGAATPRWRTGHRLRTSVQTLWP
jgi:hypothetical protein